MNATAVKYDIAEIDPGSTAEVPFSWGRLRWAYDGVISHCRPGDRMLDVGCGRGFLLEAFQEAGLAPCGIDLDPDALAEARARCPRLEVRSYDGFHIPYPDRSFRAVTLVEVLEHVADEAAVLREIHRVLQPGGVLVLTTPHAGPWAWMDPDNFKFRLPWAHRLFYRLLGRGSEFDERFGRRQGVVGNFTRRTDGGQLWHRHYSRRDVEALARGFETTACRREGGLVFSVALVVNYVWEKVFGYWPRPVTALMRRDARRDLGERGWAMQMVLRRVPG